MNYFLTNAVDLAVAGCGPRGARSDPTQPALARRRARWRVALERRGCLLKVHHHYHPTPRGSSMSAQRTDIASHAAVNQTANARQYQPAELMTSVPQAGHACALPLEICSNTWISRHD